MQRGAFNRGADMVQHTRSISYGYRGLRKHAQKGASSELQNGALLCATSVSVTTCLQEHSSTSGSAAAWLLECFCYLY